MPDCTSQRFEIQGPGGRALVADFSGGQITSDGGVMLLGQGLDLARRYSLYVHLRKRQHQILFAALVVLEHTWVLN